MIYILLYIQLDESFSQLEWPHPALNRHLQSRVAGECGKNVWLDSIEHVDKDAFHVKR